MAHAQEKQRLVQIEVRLTSARHLLDGFLPLWTDLNRKVQGLRSEIDVLEEERLKLQEGQLTMNFEELNF